MSNHEELENEARKELANHFIRAMPVDVVPGSSMEGGGTYVHFQFDTIRNPQGEGDFRVAMVKADGEWHIADYEALPMGAHRKEL